MAMLARGFYEFALRLAASTEESDVRSVISRCYYCAYHEALSVGSALPDHYNMVNTRGGVHEQLAKKLSEFPLSLEGFSKDRVMKIRALGVLLNQLKTQRKRADYDLQATFSASDSAKCIKQSEAILLKIKELVDLL